MEKRIRVLENLNQSSKEEVKKSSFLRNHKKGFGFGEWRSRNSLWVSEMKRRFVRKGREEESHKQLYGHKKMKEKKYKIYYNEKISI